jgi:PKD repeat protein
VVVEWNTGDCHASFSWDQVEGTYGIHFINTSDDDPDIVTWFWNFGDGQTSDEEHPTHEYDTSGGYLVCLAVVNEFGCVSDVCHEVHVYENTEGCSASFTWEQIDGHEAIHFNGASESQNDITSYHWNFGDGHEGDGQAPNHEFEPGVYVVCLTITDNTGCVSDVCHEVVVEAIEDGCHAIFDWEYLQDGLTVRFHSLSTSEHDIVSFHWTFGDGGTGDTWNPLHHYDAPGVYLVCLTITDGAGCVSTICQEVVVEGPDGCHAYFDFEVEEDIYNFFNNSTGLSDHATFLWEFGDGTSSTDENPEHHYDEDGTYVVCLFVTDTVNQCETHICHEIHFEAMFQEHEFEELRFSPPLSATPSGFTSTPTTEIFLKSYTNPAAAELQVIYTTSGAGDVTIELYDLMGMRVKELSNTSIMKGRHNDRFDISDVFPGMYILAIRFGDQVISRNVVRT